MLGLFLTTYCWPYVPVTCQACQALQVTAADDAETLRGPGESRAGGYGRDHTQQFLAGQPIERYMLIANFLSVSLGSPP